MRPLDELDALLAAQIHPHLWDDDPHYTQRAARLGSLLSAEDWRMLFSRRAARDLAWAERAAQTLADAGGQAAPALLAVLAHDPEPSVARIAQEALHEGPE